MPDPRPSCIIAEDSAPNRKILAHLLDKLGFDVVVCENGAEAWAKVQAGEVANLELVVSDIMMPIMDGLEFLRNVRENEATKTLKFVLVTAMGDKDNIIKARSLNVSGYILKPLAFPRILQKMQELFPERKFPQKAG